MTRFSRHTVKRGGKKTKQLEWNRNRNCQEVDQDDPDPSGNDEEEDDLETLGIEDWRGALREKDN